VLIGLKVVPLLERLEFYVVFLLNLVAAGLVFYARRE
jgi:hypothetical protein